ncbi:Tn3 family transposase [Kribbella solani]|uniref:Tn3 family transposase n=1 Tax=Kribbella solani TaxID=236067 RepID=UPI0029B04922|nr:Tn3 family transposase [Kribbella solani]MDX3005341.1 Tn3 family transposase [Kribbella solani]
MDRSVELDELVEHWTLLDDERVLLAGKGGAGRLGFALLLKFYTRHGRFPRGRGEVPDAVVRFVADQVKVPASELGLYEWSGRTVERHRAQIRSHLGFRECSVEDSDKVTAWLAAEVCEAERDPARVREQLLSRCRVERIEPPTQGRMDRIVRSALHQAETAMSCRIAGRIPAAGVKRPEALVDVDPDDAIGGSGGTGEDVLALVKSVPGNVSLESMLTEIRKLRVVRAIGLPAGLFADVAPKVLAGWRTRAAVESPSHLRTHPPDLRLTLLAALLHSRQREITDTLVDLLISTVHRIGARADRRVTQELVNAFKKVTGKENILFSIAAAALDAPDEPVRDVVFPAVNGGEQTLRELVHEYKTKGPVYRRTVQTTLKASYTNHYRRGLIELLEVLEFRSNNTTHRPVLDALELVARHADARLTYYPAGEHVPTHRGLVGDWEALVYRADERGRQRVVRATYEICAFQALRERLRCKEIWVEGADRWRNPDQDLPADFEERRTEHYAALRKPLDPTVFVDQLRDELQTELAALDEQLPDLDWVAIGDRGKQGPIKLTPLDTAPEPRNLRALKSEIRTRWGTVPLIDMLKEAVLRTGCLDHVTSTAGRGDLSREVLAERLLLVVYAYGTNTGIRAVSGGEHGHSEDDLRYVRRRYLSPEVARAMAVQIADATFAARRGAVWGAGSSAVASDSTHFGALDQNLFTEWHSRYGGRGVLIYWHVERKSMAIHSQVINCSASEVAAMIEGAMRHGTAMEVDGNYTDSHGQSEIGFGLTRLLGFDLLPRIKRINHAKLYRPAAGQPDAYPNLTAALTRPIRWDVIGEQYDQMVRYATAIRSGTASTEAILRRFAKANAIHPTYQAMIETGRAQKTLFVARYLRDRDLQREINEGLNVVEAWNRGNSVIFYGKGGDIASNRRDEQELSVLCLRVLQAALVYVNTLLVQDVLGDPGWAEKMTDVDHRGLSPLFWTHVAPYGEVRLNMRRRLALRTEHRIESGPAPA